MLAGCRPNCRTSAGGKTAPRLCTAILLRCHLWPNRYRTRPIKRLRHHPQTPCVPTEEHADHIRARRARAVNLGATPSYCGTENPRPCAHCANDSTVSCRGDLAVLNFWFRERDLRGFVSCRALRGWIPTWQRCMPRYLRE